jgi:uncharacterized protein YkwD
VSLLAVFVVGRADGSTRAWSVYLAPDSACASASDPNAPAAVQTRAVVCLVNYARAQDRRKLLVQRPRLHLAAELKGERVATCKQFSHTPCGAALTSDVQAAGYRYSTFGENLFAGTWGHYSARDVVDAWLNSPPHRANMLNGRFRDFGAAPRAGDRPARRRRRGRLDRDVRHAPLALAPARRSPHPDREGPTMAEESHLDEMRAAIRGDFERLAERRGDQELLRTTDPEEASEEAEWGSEAEVKVGAEDGRSWLARILAP